MTDDRRDQLAEALAKRAAQKRWTWGDLADTLAPLVDRMIEAEAARWQAKIEALADEIDTEADVQNVLGAGNWKIAGMIGLAARLRALRDGEQ